MNPPKPTKQVYLGRFSMITDVFIKYRTFMYVFFKFFGTQDTPLKKKYSLNYRKSEHPTFNQSIASRSIMVP